MVNDSQNTLPYLGLGYIASVLEENGFFVDIIECTRENVWGTTLIDRLKKEKYELIGISIFDYNYKNAIKLINLIVDANIDAFIVAGGMFATTNYEDILRCNKRVNCCVIGEGEITTLELAKKILSNEEISNVKGIAYLDNNDVFVTSRRDYVNDLDKLPFPKRQFSNPGGKIQIKTSRGCEQVCLFCATSATGRLCSGKQLRFRNPLDITQEIIHCIKQDTGVKRIFFIDDSFLSVRAKHEEWLIELSEHFARNGINIPFDIYARAKGIIKHEHLLNNLKKCGLSSVFIGIESFVDEQLNFYNKHTTKEENLKAINILKKHSIPCDIGFIPLDHRVSLESVIENYYELNNSAVIDIAENFKAFSLNRAVIALNGTPLREMLVETGKYVENERGYVFSDNRVERLFQVTKLWAWKINGILSKSYLTELFRQSGDMCLLSESINVNREFMRLDVDFMLFISTTLKEESTTEQDISKIIDRYAMKANILKQKYDEIESKIPIRREHRLR